MAATGGRSTRKGTSKSRAAHVPSDRGDSLTTRPRLVVGITGSSAPHYGINLLRSLHELGSVEIHLVLSEQGRENVKLEAGLDPASIVGLADVVHDPGDYAAAISSGSFLTMGMVVVPCSMSTLASIANGITSNLLVRAADVTLKERRRLVLVPRETPPQPCPSAQYGGRHRGGRHGVAPDAGLLPRSQDNR